MHLAEPTQIVTSALDGPVLIALARARTPLTGLEVHRVARRGSPDGVRLALQRLAAQGIVEARQQGRAIAYRLNRDHLGAAAVIELATLTDRLIDAIRTDIQEWEIQPVHASLFGSVLRDDSDEDSDVDLFVIRPSAVVETDPAWSDQVGALRASVVAWSGNDLQVVERAPDEVEHDEPWVETVRNDARHLAGEHLEAVLDSA